MTKAPEVRLAPSAYPLLIGKVTGDTRSTSRGTRMDAAFDASLGRLGWSPGPRRRILSDHRFSAELFSATSDEPTILCEMARDAKWPCYFERRKIRGELERRLAGRVHGSSISEAVGSPAAGISESRIPAAAALDVPSTPLLASAVRLDPTAGSPPESDPDSRPGMGRARPGVWREGGLLVFTDMSHSTYLWTWNQRAPNGFVRYIELPLEPEERLARALAVRSSVPFSASRESRGRGTVEREIKELTKEILRHLPEASRQPTRGLGLVDWCVRRAEPDDIRHLWKVLSRVRVIDPNCGSGEWLLEMGGWLEAVYIACLDRLRSQSFEASSVGGTMRHAEWSQFFFDIETFSSVELGHMTGSHVRRRVVERNLFGWEIDRRLVRRTRRLLREYAECSGALAAEPNIRLCLAGSITEPDMKTARAGHRIPHPDLHELLDGRVEQPPDFSRLALFEELRALELAREVALDPAPGSESPSESRRSRREWERRRRQLIRNAARQFEELSTGGKQTFGTIFSEGLGLWVNKDIRLVRRRPRRSRPRAN